MNNNVGLVKMGARWVEDGSGGCVLMAIRQNPATFLSLSLLYPIMIDYLLARKLA